MKTRKHQWTDGANDTVKAICIRCGLVRIRTGQTISLNDNLSAIYYKPAMPETIQYKAGNCVKKHKTKA